MSQKTRSKTRYLRRALLDMTAKTGRVKAEDLSRRDLDNIIILNHKT